MLIKSAQAEQGFVISESIKKAWQVFKKDWIIILAVQLLPIAVAIVYTIVLETIDQESALAIVWNIAYIALQFIVSMGVIKAYLNITRGKKVTIETFTSQAPKILNFFAAQILMMLIVLGGFILLIIPGFYFSLKYMFTPYLVIDKNMGPIEALKASGKITHGIKWDLIGFMAATVVLMYAGILALGIGLIVTVPVATLAYVVLFNKVVKRIK